MLVQLITGGLVTWRISSLLVNERGPFNVFTRFRELTGIQHWPDGTVAGASLNNPLSCIWCTSMYVGVLVAGLVNIAGAYRVSSQKSPLSCKWLPYESSNFIVSGLAFSALAVLVDKWLERQQ